jgi:hypothetical protein
VIDSTADEHRVVALVEVQRRKSKVGLEDFGNWIYKRDTIKAKELVAVSESGFAKSVIDHTRKLHPDSVRLGTLHEVTTGLIGEFNSNCLGITRILDLWWFASIFVQYADPDEIVAIPRWALPIKLLRPARPTEAMLASTAPAKPGYRRMYFCVLVMIISSSFTCHRAETPSRRAALTGHRPRSRRVVDCRWASSMSGRDRPSARAIRRRSPWDNASGRGGRLLACTLGGRLLGRSFHAYLTTKAE